MSNRATSVVLPAARPGWREVLRGRGETIMEEATAGPRGFLVALLALFLLGTLGLVLALLVTPIWLARRGKYLGAFGALVLLLTVALAALAPVIAPFGYDQVFLSDRLHAPSGRYLLGTDQNGRDIFTRVLYGAEVTVLVGFGTVVATALLATALGLVSGYFAGENVSLPIPGSGRRLPLPDIDTFVQRLVDVWIAFPAIFLLLTIVAIFGSGGDGIFGIGRGPDIGPQAGFNDRWFWEVFPRTTVVIVSLSLILAGGGSRVIRGSVLSLKNEAYVEAARALGAGNVRVMVTHITPNIIPVVIILASVNLGIAVLAEATISFLGFGIVPPYPTWGQMVSGLARVLGPTNWWVPFFPGLAIFVAVYGFNMMGDALRDVLDPRLRGR